MKRILLSLFLLSSPALFAYSGKNYDNGYEAAWEGEEKPSSFWTSKEEKEGYENGLADSSTYNSGYDDGYDEKRPEYFNDALYMDGYKDGKKDKERR